MVIEVIQKKPLPLDRKHFTADLGMFDHHQENHHPVVEIGLEEFRELSPR